MESERSSFGNRSCLSSHPPSSHFSSPVIHRDWPGWSLSAIRNSVKPSLHSETKSSKVEENPYASTPRSRISLTGYECIIFRALSQVPMPSKPRRLLNESTMDVMPLFRRSRADAWVFPYAAKPTIWLLATHLPGSSVIVLSYQNDRVRLDLEDALTTLLFIPRVIIIFLQDVLSGSTSLWGHYLCYIYLEPLW